MKRIKFLKYIDSYRLIYRYEWDIIAVPAVSTLLYFVSLTLLQSPLWISPFFSVLLGYKTLKLYQRLIKDAAPGYLYHFFYTAGIINPTKIRKKNGKKIRENIEAIPFGFEDEFRD